MQNTTQKGTDYGWGMLLFKGFIYLIHIYIYIFS